MYIVEHEIVSQDEWKSSPSEEDTLDFKDDSFPCNGE